MRCDVKNGLNVDIWFYLREFCSNEIASAVANIAFLKQRTYCSFRNLSYKDFHVKTETGGLIVHRM
jgi:hypothetical protein